MSLAFDELTDTTISYAYVVPISCSIVINNIPKNLMAYIRVRIR